MYYQWLPDVVVLEVTYGSSMGLVSEGCDRPGIIASKKVFILDRSRTLLDPN